MKKIEKAIQTLKDSRDFYDRAIKKENNRIMQQYCQGAIQALTINISRLEELAKR